MKKTAIILAALFAGVSLRAQAPASSYSITVDFPYTSEYVFRGGKLAEDSFQPSVEIAGSNWYAGVWTNQPLTDNTDNEVDFYLGFGVPLSDTWKVDTGATLYYYPELDHSTGADNTTVEGYVGLTGTVSGFTPALYTYYDFTLEAWTYQGSLGYSFPLTDRVSLDLAATVGAVDPDVGGNYVYYGLGAVLPYKLTDKATASLGLQFATTDMSGADEHVYVTAGITLGL